ncbi:MULTISPECIES: D-2-hydroxyacid dehydrogenase [unclassified Paenibacillus]|uniref:D-2-hydroxyacid dehydrogenase n=1 Tax=unclassified Paenibacillus TaxID=185978 RepID=UPI00083803B9|nr:MULTISPECIES: D-2-hydroxyacid dehydrogenase [unclassified Paenibacillus]NWL88203.1 D-2-hydroxyacid dehydrogenase [Paenibacillus sp. 79R4]
MKIVVLDGYRLNPGDLSWDELIKLGEVIIFDRTSDDKILERAQGAQLLLTNKTPLCAATMQQLPDLQYIGVLATGYDVIDVKASTSQQVVVTNVPSYGTDSVAQFVFAQLFELCHQVGQHARSVRQGAWSANPDWCYWDTPLVELAGKTMGIIGAGRIGMQTARIAHAIGMKVIAMNGKKETDREVPFDGFRWVARDQLFRDSDVISLHCPLTAETEFMINKTHLGLMKPNAFLINVARGKLVNEIDLAHALNERRIAGAALDVLSTEPPASENPLLHAPNCIITPHIAWATREARGRLLDIAVDNVRSFLDGKPQNVVNCGQCYSATQ